MTAGKPDNLLRRTLTGIGVSLYRLGLAPAIIKLNSKRIRALLYHAVESESDAFTNGLNVSVSPTEFAANLDYFKRFYNVVSMSQVAAGQLPSRPLVITFDDGYYSVYEHATPALHERGLPACVYLISRAVKGNIVWVNLLNYALHEHNELARQALSGFEKLSGLNNHQDILATVQHTFSPEETEAVCSALKEALPHIDHTQLYASETDIVDMQNRGIEFGFHTRDHYNLKNCNDSELALQLDSSGCQQVLNSNTFAYPFGYFSRSAVSHVEACEYDRIMTVGNNNDVYSTKHLDRTEVFTDNPALLFAQLEIVEPVIAKLRKWMLKPGREEQTSAKSYSALGDDVEARKNHT